MAAQASPWTSTWKRGSRIVLVATAVALTLPDPALAVARTERVSVRSSGGGGNMESAAPAISARGRFVAFASDASNLVASDTNDYADIFVRDRENRTTRRVSVRSNGRQANNDSETPAISKNGRFVAFRSFASNLVRGDTNGEADIFVHDRSTGRTERVSVSSGGDEANGESEFPAISADGRFVSFASSASNLVGGDTNGVTDVFVHDRVTGRTRRVSVNGQGFEGNGVSLVSSISADGRFVAFESLANNLVDDDTNGVFDVFVRDRAKSRTRRVSVSSSGDQANGASSDPAISADGRFVAFSSGASNLIGTDTNAKFDIFVRDRAKQRTRRVSVSSAGVEGNDHSTTISSISADGRRIAFESLASNLVGGDGNGFYDIFVHDRGTGRTRRVSIGPGGVEANDASADPAISADGRYVAYVSAASNLITGDGNGVDDIFVRGPLG